MRSPAVEITRWEMHEQFSPRMRASPVCTFHTRTVSSQPPEARCLPSGKKATEVICRVERPRMRAVPVSTSHNLIAASRDRRPRRQSCVRQVRTRSRLSLSTRLSTRASRPSANSKRESCKVSRRWLQRDSFRQARRRAMATARRPGPTASLLRTANRRSIRVLHLQTRRARRSEKTPATKPGPRTHSKSSWRPNSDSSDE